MRNNQPRATDAVLKVHADLHERIAGLAARARLSSRPLLRLSAKRPAEHLGCGVLLAVDSYRFLLTATHVLDCFGGDPIHIAGEGVVVPVAGRAERTLPPPGQSRNDDPIDAAVLRIENEWGNPPGLQFLQMRDVSLREWMSPAGEYLLYGYPESKVSVDLPGKTIRGDHFQLVSPRASDSVMERAGLDQRLHVGFDFDTTAMMSTTGVRAAPRPNGMSGCGVWELSQLREPGVVLSGKLVAVFTEYRRATKLGVAPRLAYFIEVIRQGWPELSSKLGSHGAAPIRMTELSPDAT